MNKKVGIIIAVVAVLALGGVGYALLSGGDDGSSGSGSSSSQSQPAELEGNELVQAVLDKVEKETPTVKETRIITEDTDSNNLIGKQGEYQYAGSFYDTRTDYRPTDDNGNSISIEKDVYKTTAGGSIEVFATAEDAKKRGELLEGFQSGFLNAGPYEVVDNVVLRVSENYKASEQKQMLQLMKSAL